MAGITFDRFQQMKVAIGTARFIERDQETFPWVSVSAEMQCSGSITVLHMQRVSAMQRACHSFGGMLKSSVAA